MPIDQVVDAVLKSDEFERLSLGALVDSRLAGVAQYARRGDAPIADMAIFVADEWQSQGLGAQLAAALASLAEARGTCHVAVSIQLDNPGATERIRHVAQSTKFVLVGGGVAEADVSLADLRRGRYRNHFAFREDPQSWISQWGFAVQTVRRKDARPFPSRRCCW